VPIIFASGFNLIPMPDIGAVCRRMFQKSLRSKAFADFIGDPEDKSRY
jgi:hypothetical protein